MISRGLRLSRRRQVTFPSAGQLLGCLAEDLNAVGASSAGMKWRSAWGTQSRVWCAACVATTQTYQKSSTGCAFRLRFSIPSGPTFTDAKEWSKTSDEPVGSALEARISANQ